MATNNSPHVKKRIQDKSLGVVPLGAGNGAFICGGQWGPCGKVFTVQSENDLRDMLDEPVVGNNHQSWHAIAQHVEFYSGGAKIVRPYDTAGLANSCLIASVDSSTTAFSTTGTTSNGTAIPYNLNVDADISITPTLIPLQKLTCADGSVFSAGGDISGETSGAAGTVAYIIGNYVYVKDITGGPFQAENLDDTAIYAATITTSTAVTQDQDQVLYLYAKYPGSRGNDIKVAFCDHVNFHDRTRLTVGTDAEAQFAAGDVVVGSTSNASGIVYASDTTNHYLYLRDVSGVFQAENLTVIGEEQWMITVGAGEENTFTVGEKVYQSSSIYGYVSDIDTTSHILYLANSGTGTFTTAAVTGTSGGAGTASAVANVSAVASAFDATGLGSTADGTNTFKALVKNETGTETLASDEYALLVYVDDVLTETHVVSHTTTSTKPNGNEPNYIDYLLENDSAWLYSVTDVSGVSFDDFSGSFQKTSLAGGTAAQCSISACQVAYDTLFNDTRNGIYFVGDYHDMASYDVSNYRTLTAYMVGKAELSREHFCISTLPKAAISDTAFDINTLNESVAGINSKYISITDQWKEIWCKYNRRKYFIPTTGDVMGLVINNVEQNGDWEAPFGNTKGVMRNTTKLYHNLSTGEASNVSDLYGAGINSIIYKEDIGFVLWGQKTRFNPASDLSRINAVLVVTRDMKVLSKLLDNYISYNLNESLYALVTVACDRGYLAGRSASGAYLSQNGDGGYEFVCSSQNNTPATQKANTLVVDFYVRPAKAVEYIHFTAIVTPSGTTFKELVG